MACEHDPYASVDELVVADMFLDLPQAKEAAIAHAIVSVRIDGILDLKNHAFHEPSTRTHTKTPVSKRDPRNHFWSATAHCLFNR